MAWYHHFIHIACARKLRGLRQKLDALRVQNGQSLSKYQDFIRKLVCYKGISFFKPYLNSWLFVCSKCTIQSHIIIFQSFLTSFVIFMHLLIILSYKTLKLKSISNELWKGWKLAWYHHFIHIAYARKLRGLRQKLDALRVQNGQSLSKYQSFIRKLVCYTYLNSLVFCVQNAPFKAPSSIYNPFWLHLLFFMHLLIILSYKTMKLKSIWNELW